MFVCMGNICRSPLAEGVFRHRARETGVLDRFDIASSGTGGWHAGEPPDRRMRETAERYGVSLDGQRAQRLNGGHLDAYDLVLVMDHQNLRHVTAMCRTDAHHQKVKLFRTYDPEPGDGAVPDPYYGGQKGFDTVFQMVDRTVGALLQDLVDERR